MLRFIQLKFGGRTARVPEVTSVVSVAAGLTFLTTH